MRLLTKTTPWVVAALLAAATAFGEDKDKCRHPKNEDTCRHKKSFEQSRKLDHEQMMPAYNGSASIDVRGSWDLFVQGSFIYWQFAQDNMEVAFADTLTNTAYMATQLNGNYVPMHFDFKPGFKIGFGMDTHHDNWDWYAQYTMLHAKNTASTNGLNAPDGSPAPLLPTWGSPFVHGGNVYNTASESWTCNLDAIDLNLGRVYYVGTHLTFKPEFGARAAWIRQNVGAFYNNLNFTNAVTAPIEVKGTTYVRQRSHSWAVGPQAGIDTNWIIGQCFRFFGNASADVLYTKYKLQNRTLFTPTPVVPGTEKFLGAKEDVPTVRTHLDFELGLGWGSYFDNNNWHVDLSASYGFQVFMDQNMLTKFVSSTAAGSAIQPSGNLYAQGLTASARFDF